jgi:DNA-binding LacI/PurR family transcriptional regulator
MDMATMRDVAEAADVSIATVSFVVNGTKPVSPATRARIETAMVELGFRQNVLARALASRSTRIIALVFPALEHKLGSTALSVVTSAAVAANARGYNLVLWPVSNDGAQLNDYVASGLVDGVLLMEVQVEDARVQRLQTLDVPFGLIGRTNDPAELTYVDMDFDQTVEDAVDYLMGLGHRRFALVIGELENNTLTGYGPIVRTEAAFRRRMAAEGLEQVVVSSAQGPAPGKAAAVTLMAEHPDTTAIIVLNEDAAFGVLTGVQAAGYLVPRDVSILSIATSPDAIGISDPELSTMVAPGAELGRLSTDALIDQLEGKTGTLTQQLIVCALQPAESTGPARS